MRTAWPRPKTSGVIVVALLAALAESTACAGPSAVSFGVGVRTPAPWGTTVVHTAVPLYPLYGPWPPMGPRRPLMRPWPPVGPPPPPMRPQRPMGPPPPPMRQRPPHWW